MGYVLDMKYLLPILREYDFMHSTPNKNSEELFLSGFPDNFQQFNKGDHKVLIDDRKFKYAVHRKDFEVLNRHEVPKLYAEVYPITDDPAALIKHVGDEFNVEDCYVIFKDGSFRVVFLFNSNDDASAFVDEPYLIFNDRLYLITRDFFSDDVCDDDVDELDDSCDDFTTIEEQLKDMIDSPKQIVKIPLSDQYVQRMLNRLKQQLPVFFKYNEILDRVDSERVCVLVGSTGCGKSTQLPVYLAELYCNSGKRIAITQPCALATMTIYNRIFDEYEDKVGYDGADKPIYSNYVGYLTESDSQNGSQIMVIQEDKLFSYDLLLSEFSVLIIDEVHIRSISTDIILGVARDILRKRSDFRVVICSATIDTSKYINYFCGDNSSILPISVPGRVYDVRVFENPVDPSSLSIQLPLVVKEAIVNPAYYEDGDCTGHVLVFVPSVESVGPCMNLFKNACKGSDEFNNIICKPLHEKLSYEQQLKVIEFDRTHQGKRMVCFCTSIAETSLTVPNVRLVIDSGLTVRSRFDDVSRLTLVETVLISKSSSEQRKGRCGRTCPGVFIPLYHYNDPKRVEYDPDILTSSVDLLSLKMMALGIDPETFEYIEAPPRSISKSVELLRELDCIYHHNNNIKLSAVGNIVLSLQIDPRRVYFTYLMARQGFLSLGALITAILSTNHPLILDKLEFYDYYEPIKSDLISLVLIFQRLVKLKGVKFPNSVNKDVFRSIRDNSKSIDSAFLKINELSELNKNHSVKSLSFNDKVIYVINKCLLASFGNTMFTNIPDVSNVLVSNDQKSVLQVHPLSFFHDNSSFFTGPMLALGLERLGPATSVRIIHPIDDVDGVNNDCADQLETSFATKGR
ncbi:hypothetical protein GEMRC1_012071 [Eukaryota sp. GEM-RC1]